MEEKIPDTVLEAAPSSLAKDKPENDEKQEGEGSFESVNLNGASPQPPAVTTGGVEDKVQSPQVSTLPTPKPSVQKISKFSPFSKIKSLLSTNPLKAHIKEERAVYELKIDPLDEKDLIRTPDREDSNLASLDDFGGAAEVTTQAVIESERHIVETVHFPQEYQTVELHADTFVPQQQPPVRDEFSPDDEEFLSVVVEAEKVACEIVAAAAVAQPVPEAEPSTCAEVKFDAHHFDTHEEKAVEKPIECVREILDQVLSQTPPNDSSTCVEQPVLQEAAVVSESIEVCVKESRDRPNNLEFESVFQNESFQPDPFKGSDPFADPTSPGEILADPFEDVSFPAEDRLFTQLVKDKSTSQSPTKAEAIYAEISEVKFANGDPPPARPARRKLQKTPSIDDQQPLSLNDSRRSSQNTVIERRSSINSDSCQPTILEETFPGTAEYSSPSRSPDNCVERVYEEISEDHFSAPSYQEDSEATQVFAKKLSEEQTEFIDERFHVDIPHSLVKKRQEAAAAANKKTKGLG